MSEPTSTGIKLWLDEHREAPPGWLRATTVDDAVHVLDSMERLDVLSLNIDLPDVTAISDWLDKNPDKRPQMISGHSSKEALP